DDEVGEFVGVTGSGSLRDQAGQAGAVVERLGLIEDGTGEPERLSHLGDGGPLDVNAAQHLVLDLYQVARVEELAAEEPGVGHLLGVGIQDTLLTERFGFGVQGLGHEDLRRPRVSVNLITPSVRGLSRGSCRESSVIFGDLSRSEVAAAKTLHPFIGKISLTV